MQYLRFIKYSNNSIEDIQQAQTEYMRDILVIFYTMLKTCLETLQLM